jgi:aspartate ammonia-lyase
MEKSVIITFLKGIELFRGLNNIELKKLAESVREKRYTIGEYLFLENTATLRHRCIDGIKANLDRCRMLVHNRKRPA